jgi:putative addiction module killer protein
MWLQCWNVHCPPNRRVRRVARRTEGQACADPYRSAPTAGRSRKPEAGSLGDWQPIEGEVSEMRVHYGPGYRLYFVRRGRVIVVMLNAGDKRTQKRDIRHALKLASELGDDL